MVAERLENAVILQRLAELGCDEAQGYHISRTLPLAGFNIWAGALAGGRPTLVLPLGKGAAMLVR